ncbi:MAG TPA: NAD(P)-dependent oxidoreductase [Terriglobales bacterium]|nr:NAD(P)-dependent oxidoreductase [Terriglobales bacterium]HUB85666.1 NAD(P)-dependent oxidoreductase [Rhizomicrobium sp.]
MKVALLGATGFMGSALLNEALSRGHSVTAVARDAGKLAARERLVTKSCDLFDATATAEILRGHDAVISAFNPGWKNPHLYEDQVRGTASILAAIGPAGIRRVLWVGGAGGLELKPGVRVIDAPDFPAWVKLGSLATMDALEQLRKHAELASSYLSPWAQMTPGARTGKLRLGGDKLLVDARGDSRISVEDFAVAMTDELEKPSHPRQRFTVGY